MKKKKVSWFKCLKNNDITSLLNLLLEWIFECWIVALTLNEWKLIEWYSSRTRGGISITNEMIVTLKLRINSISIDANETHEIRYVVLFPPVIICISDDILEVSFCKRLFSLWMRAHEPTKAVKISFVLVQVTEWITHTH